MDRTTRRSTRLGIVAALVISGCSGGVIDRGDGTIGDRQDEALSSIAQEPHGAVCSGHKYHCKAHVRLDAGGAIKMHAAPQGYGPADLAAAYQLDTALNPGITIAIVDAYGYANAEKDLTTYRSNYGLPACTTANGCLKIVNQSGAASPLPGKPPAGDDWTVETALDLDLASAACPSCKLLLIQANDDESDGMFLAQNTAVSLGAKVISNSWGGVEQSSSASYEKYFNHAGVGVFVATGDDGYDDGGKGPDYPSTSAYVTAVGATSLVKTSANARGWTEGAWSSSGSSCSTHIAKPGYQAAAACKFRATADVSAVGDPNTGAAIYNSSYGWIIVGGTSAAAPFVAGVYALTGKATVGPSFPYANTAAFYDVTTGSNGSCSGSQCHAGAGWDGPTGIGTPNGAVLAGGGSTCTPACSGKQCGSDGCGGSCGSCAGGASCSAAGQCTTTCTPSCSGKSCGSDGCGGTCGSCSGGESCSATGQCMGGACAHPICSTGATLTSACDPCATKVCAKDAYCCATAWDSQCVGEVASICGQSCGGGSCAHAICSSGTKLTATCDPCAAKICAADSYCCSTRWDSQCVSEVSSICKQGC